MNLYVKTYRHSTSCLLAGGRPKLLSRHKALFMRISILAILLTFSGLLMARSGNGQDLNKIIISIDLKNASLKEAIKKIESLTQLAFTYRTADVAEVDHINYQASKASVNNVLADLLQHTGLQYDQVNGNIVIKKINKQEQLTNITIIEEATFEGGIRGRVIDETGAPLANASIVVLGTDRGTAANKEGVFNITGLKAGKYKLQVSAVNFTSQITEITIKDNETLDVLVALKEGTGKLEEVIVTALGISRKERSVGYSTQEIKGDNLTVAKEQNVLGSLGGKIAGVQLSGSSGASMGGTQKIQIRGTNFLTGGGEPLIVVDNTPISNSNFAIRNGRDYGNLAQDINPDDIESINVLKGPAASALYGLRGQFGVIMITTRKGKNAQKPAVNFSSAYSVEKAGNFLPLQNTYGAGSSLSFPTVDINGVPTKFVDGTWDESWGPVMDGTPVRHEYSFYPGDPDFGKETPFVPHPNNIKDYFETGHTWNNSISFSGGGQNTLFRLSYNNTDMKGIEPNTWLKRNNLSFSGSLNVTPNLVVSTSLNYANNKARRPSQGYQSLGSRNMYQWFQRNLDMNKLKQYKYADGTFYQWNVAAPKNGVYTSRTSPIDWNNPYFDAYENPSNDSRDRFFGNIGVSYTVMPGLKVNGFVRQDGFIQNIDGRNAEGGRGVPSFWIGKYESKEMNYEFLATYNKEVGNFSFGANLGGNLMTQRYTYLRQETQGGFVSPGFYDITNSLNRPLVKNILRRKEVRSAYGSVNLGYKNTYFIDASLRRDISSALPPDNNAYLYPSVSTSMVFSELLKVAPISYGKIRASFAQAGSDIDIYQTTNSYAMREPYGTNFPMYVPDTLKNPELKPSLGTAYEAGLDMRFLQDRVGFSFTWYYQQSENAVMNLDVSGVSGYSKYVINAGNIQNKGIELTVSGTPIRMKNLSWTSSFNIARNKNVIKELYPGINSLILDQNRYSSVDMFLLANVNESFGSIVGNAYMRDTATGKILLDATNMPMYVTNHNFGTVLPKFTGGWQNTVTWKNFDLSAVIDFQKGGQFFSWTKMLAVKSGQAAETAVINENGKNIRDPLTDGGGIKINGISSSSKQEVTAFVNARTWYRNNLGTRIYEEWLFDASYIRMREIRVGYTFSKANIAKLPVKSLNLAFITRNPFMIWQKAPKGLNPAELATGATSFNWLETGQLATTRSFGVNLNVSF
ncbi:SusC/RagA family TonB-linked outer membrane protein [Niastella yeongjuensis]|uniref:SusC/RagA family TonB-linked outer membrane protein n=2 Tax=Niastella yeongjuensis TaxID=354355 RepID=A0A1V9EX72_9BACT|nr:SusC/RagA family TonB-linked outer membrane protein [Niastella yeongjuensis]SEN22574.1 TonB-linked outer membrane protein, SusC/RagA family [Niastella yeongjuensis]